MLWSTVVFPCVLALRRSRDVRRNRPAQRDIRNRADSVDQDVARADRQKDYAAYRCMKYKNLEGRWQDKFSLVKDWLILALQMSAA